MTHFVVVTEWPEAELHQTARWYDNQRLGLAKFELTVTQIQQFPESFELIEATYHRAVLGRFPYFIAYRVLPDVIRILRVMPERGDPRSLALLTRNRTDE